MNKLILIGFFAMAFLVSLVGVSFAGDHGKSGAVAGKTVTSTVIVPSETVVIPSETIVVPSKTVVTPQKTVKVETRATVLQGSPTVVEGRSSCVEGSCVSRQSTRSADCQCSSGLAERGGRANLYGQRRGRTFESRRGLFLFPFFGIQSERYVSRNRERGFCN